MNFISPPPSGNSKDETLYEGVRWSLVPSDFFHLVPGPIQILSDGPWSQPYFANWSHFSLISASVFNPLAYPSGVCVYVCVCLCVCVRVRTCPSSLLGVHVLEYIYVWHNCRNAATRMDISWLLRDSSLAPWWSSWFFYGSLVTFLTFLASPAFPVHL